MTWLLAGLLLGAAGSAHCVLMCGPLVLAVNAGGSRHARGTVLYHAGRLAVYVGFGVIAGSAGRAASAGAAGRVLSIAAGLVMLAAAAGWLAGLTAPAVRWWGRYLSRGSAAIAGVGQRHLLTGRTLGGVLNGLLPCGLLSAAVVAAAAAGSAASGALLMTGFGLGTVPALAVLPAVSRRFPARARPALHRITPALLALSGVLLVVRGLMPLAGHAGHAGASVMDARQATAASHHAGAAR